MQDIDGVLESDTVYRPECVAFVSCDNLEDTGSQPSEGLSVAVLESHLGLIECESDHAPHSSGEGPHVRFAGSDPLNRRYQPESYI